MPGQISRRTPGQIGGGRARRAATVTAAVLAALAAPAPPAQAEFGELTRFGLKLGGEIYGQPRSLAVDRARRQVFVGWSFRNPSLGVDRAGVDQLKFDGTLVRSIPVPVSMVPTIFGGEAVDSSTIIAAGMAVDEARRRLYVVQPGQCRVLQYDADSGAAEGNFLYFGAPTSDRSCGQAIFNPDHYSAIAVSDVGDVYVSGKEHLPNPDPTSPKRFTNRPAVQRYGPDGVPQQRWGTVPNEDRDREAPPGTFRWPAVPILSWDSRRDELVALDYGDGVIPPGRIQRFTAAGGYIAGSARNLPAELWARLGKPSSLAADGGRLAFTLGQTIATDAAGKPVVTDESRLRVYDSDFRRLRQLGGYSASDAVPCRFPAGSPLHSSEPFRLAFDGQGGMFALLGNASFRFSRVLRFGPGGTGCNTSAPSAAFTVAPDPPLSNRRATFDASGSSDPDSLVARYRWDWDGNGTVDAETTSATVTHRFDAPGPATVELVVVDDDGRASAPLRRTLNVADGGPAQPPVARFAVTPAQPEAQQSVTFDAAGSTDDTGIESYEWDVGADGTVDARGVSATGKFPRGTVLVRLTVTDRDGFSDSTQQTVVIEPRAPVATFGYDPKDPNTEQDVRFDASASDRDRSITLYEWDFDGNGTVDATGAKPTHRFTTKGDYRVRLTVTDEKGRKAAREATITVRNPPLLPAPLPYVEKPVG